MDCKKGEYYCRQDKKCKPIPKGHHVMPDGTLMSDDEHDMSEGWSKKYKRSIDCNNPKGFSQRAHCQGRKKKVNEDLRDWFGKSKSKDGKPGWVQADGSPCANEPDDKGKTPKCFSSQRLASLKAQGKKGEAKIRSAVRRKREKDKGQQAKSGGAKPTMVRTFTKSDDYKKHPSGDRSESVQYEGMMKKDHEVSMAQSQLSNAEKDIKKLKKSLGKKEKNLPAWMQAKITDTEHNMDAAASYNEEKGPCWKGYKQVGMKKKGGKMVPNCVPVNSEEKTPMVQKILEKIECEKEWALISEKNVPTNPSLWSKMKSRAKAKFDVYPSAYANGWAAKEYKKAGGGWKTVSEEVELEEARVPAQNGNIYMVAFSWRGKMMYIKVFFPETRRPNRGQVEDAINKIYPGAKIRSYDMTVVGQGDSYLNAGSFDGGSGAKIPDIYGKFSEEIEIVYEELIEEGYLEEDVQDAIGIALNEATVTFGHDTPDKKDDKMKMAKGRLRYLRRKAGEALSSMKKKATYASAKAQVAAYNKGREIAQTAGDKTRKTRQAVGGAVQSVKDAPEKAKKSIKSYVKKQAERVADRMSEETEVSEGAAWTKKSGKNPSGGLNEKGRKSYERENPGSDLKAPSKKVGNPRRASFCARMKGMKKKLTSSKTANDPNSRINKSLRAWNC